jgi:hypothetical protein
VNYKQIYAIKRANEERILKVCPNCPNTSGIYFLLREENGFKFGYVGQAKHILERLGSHLSGYQHIDLSLKKHGFWDEKNPTGYKIHFLQFPESELDEKEQYFIKRYANAGWQMRNVESGGSQGKTDIGERRQSRGYYDGVAQGYKNAQKEIAHLFDLHLDYTTKKQPPTKLQEKALEKFKNFIDVE